MSKSYRQGRRRGKQKKPQVTQAPSAALPSADLQALRAAVTWVVGAGTFEKLKWHGNTKWVVSELITLAVFWVWSDDATLTGAFQAAQRQTLQLFGRVAIGSYQGLSGALLTVTPVLLPLIWSRLQTLMQQLGGDHFRIAGWVPLAVDGSRISTPRTAANEAAFCAPHYGHGLTAEYRRRKRRKRRIPRRERQSQPVKPQIWLTMVWHMGLRLLWCWQSGPSYSSERAHLQELLQTQKFPAKALFCGDAGFVGFDFWKQIHDQGHSFLMRVGRNVTLLRKLGDVCERDGVVYCWPQKARRQQPPLILRLLSVQVGRKRVYLATNVIHPRHLSDTVASRLYELRWGIEVQFRTLKQTFGRSQLRSKTPDRARCELDWSLVGLWMIQLFAVKEQLATGQSPMRCSTALALRAVREAFQPWPHSGGARATLKSKLQHAVLDCYPRSKRSKRARYRPFTKDKPSAGKPSLITATKHDKLQLQQYLALTS